MWYWSYFTLSCILSYGFQYKRWQINFKFSPLTINVTVGEKNITMGCCSSQSEGKREQHDVNLSKSLNPNIERDRLGNIVARSSTMDRSGVMITSTSTNSNEIETPVNDTQTSCAVKARQDYSWCDLKQSKRFLSTCKKCRDDEFSEDMIISELDNVVSKCENGFNSIDINYCSKLNGEFALKYVVKYIKPKVLSYIMEHFNDKTHDHCSIDWMIIDNPKLNNNILHYLISDLNGASQTEMNCAIEIIDIIFESTANIENLYNINTRNVNNYTNMTSLTSWDELLYQKNEYQYTPSEYAQKRNLSSIGRELEMKLFLHISQLLIVQCGIHKDIAIVIIQYTFELFHFDTIKMLYDQIKNHQ